MKYNYEGYEYYYGKEADQFSFYRIPKALFKEERFSGLSIEAKILYGFLLDRMSLSMSNGWFDEENRVYVVYTIEDVAQDLGCGRDKAIKVLAELDTKKGIGLIERKRQGFGKPDIIYVKNFVNKQKKVGESEPSSMVEKSDLSQSEKSTSYGRKNRPTVVGKIDPNNTNINNTNINNTNHIYQSREYIKQDDRIDMIDMMNVNTHIDYIKENVDYDAHMAYYEQQDKELYDELVDTICDVVCVKRKIVKIGKEDYPYELVKSKFLKLNAGHLEYVMECMKNTTTKIVNIKAYMITALYNAPNTINHYYQQEVLHDMYGC